ncbi:hypothetical protein LOTGIDRAFT_155206 [Lottia gigantea]|uniref:Uncharacterized protein n=1 Tax=Lottia gigantea TaxID=225164 RepID=V3Z4T9_LOTGI|nr:hypothetical protein LOTGIDRAFT_155206 [Lottia gigantea]ESO85713.1 hypothetical protein LOTGIDRAFT_155206 [Lottia gigantea]
MKKQKEITSNNNYLQHINFTCSYQHETSSLAAWGNSSNLPMNSRKITDIDIAKYTKDNWESVRHEWEPYAKRDTLCLGSCLIKYNQVTKEVVNQNMSNNLTAPSLSFKGWYYLYHYDKEMVEEEWYETTRMVPKHTEKDDIEKVNLHTNPFIRHYIRRSIKGGRVSANRKIFETKKMDEICNVLRESISQSETQSETESISQGDNSQSETPSETETMSDLDSEYPKAESGRPFLPQEERKFLKLFNEQKFRPRTAILTVWFKYPKNMFFQPIPAKDNRARTLRTQIIPARTLPAQPIATFRTRTIHISTTSTRDISHPGTLHPGQIPPRTISHRDISHPGTLHPGQIPPRKTSTRDISHPDTSHQDDSHPGKLPSGNFAPGQFAPNFCSHYKNIKNIGHELIEEEKSYDCGKYLMQRACNGSLVAYMFTN